MVCMEYRKCSGMGGVSVTGHVSPWHVLTHRKCSGMGGVSVTGHVSTYIVCMEYRKCSGMGGVSKVTGNVSMWHVWNTGYIKEI